jgi:hypothetical protein
MSICVNCLKPKATLKCGLCENPLCKKCAQFLEDDHFTFQSEVPRELTLGAYCGPCFDEKIYPEVSAYDEAVEKAKKVFVFYAEDAKETRLFKRDSKPIAVENCKDNYETLMTMAYLAVKNGYNTLVDVEISSEKVKLSGYQTSKWRGRGIPVKLDNYIPNRKSRFIGNYYKDDI